MAIVKLSTPVVDIRGSLGGNTFSRSAAGNIVRARKKPVDRHTPAQDKQRQVFAEASTAWSTKLNTLQRGAWCDYAAASKWMNRLGQMIKVSGQQAFVKTTAMYLAAGLAIKEDAPLVPGRTAWPLLTVTITMADQSFHVEHPSMPWDNNVDDHLLLLFQSHTYAAGRRGTPAAWRQVATFRSNGAVPLEWPAIVPSIFAVSEGGRVWLRYRHLNPDGRVSAPGVLALLIGAA